ncbi:biofilm regulation phosphoprotein SiaC [Spirochaeta africana]|uniref:SiaC family regulatory phosphoprotein domain-containing protein n=1 Tax=Spirochaeta africana (strain ATCC 700263 / DSM 8902 / Z-7692) TaxID=889378 RepID=H9UMJ3_SPIAZ|nr:biofilm regulation phosphoprotein SiaC [Spirochaeta africana]AFG38736.1 protein of unknown function (DUF1987) [Spirochaeta africana DSM 8902]
MEALHIEPTKSSPEITFDPGSGILRIQGQSYPENSFQFFEPVFAWLQQYLAQLAGPCTVQLNLDYLNTSSSKCLMDFIDLMEDAYSEGKQVRIEWLYDPDNDSSIELAEEFKEDLSLPFDILKLEE